MRIFLQFVFKWLQFCRTGRTLCCFVTTRTLPIGGGVPENFHKDWSKYIEAKIFWKVDMLHFLKYQDDTYSPFNCKRSFSTMIFNLGSVEEMREDDPGQDLQRRLENPVPSSVASKHLRRRIRQYFDFFILNLLCLGHWQSTSASARSLRRNRVHLALSTWWQDIMIFWQ